MRIHVVRAGPRNMLPLVLQFLRLSIVSVSVFEWHRSVTLSHFLWGFPIIDLLIVTSTVCLASPSRYPQIMVINCLAMVRLVAWSLPLRSRAMAVVGHVSVLDGHQPLSTVMHTQLRIVNLRSILNLVLNRHRMWLILSSLNDIVSTLPLPWGLITWLWGVLLGRYLYIGLYSLVLTWIVGLDKTCLGQFLLHTKLAQMTSSLLPWFEELLISYIGGCSLLSTILISIDLLKVVHAHTLAIVVLRVHLIVVLRTATVMVVHVYVWSESVGLLESICAELLGLGCVCVDWNPLIIDWCSLDALVAHLRYGVIMALHRLRDGRQLLLVAMVANLGAWCL